MISNGENSFEILEVSLRFHYWERVRDLINLVMSTIVIGVFVWLFSATGIYSLNFSFIDCIIFGSILSK